MGDSEKKCPKYKTSDKCWKLCTEAKLHAINPMNYLTKCRKYLMIVIKNDFRFKWTDIAGVGIHPTKAWLSRLVNFKNAIWTWGHFRRTICNKILPQKRMECFRLLLDHLAWIEYQFLCGIRDSRKAESLWRMMRGGGSNEVRTPELIGQIKNFMDKDRRVSKETISAQFDVSVRTVHTIIREELMIYIYKWHEENVTGEFLRRD